MASHRRRKEMMDQPGGTPMESSSAMDSMDSTERAGGEEQNEQIR
jgi:hypothetical protein